MDDKVVLNCGYLKDGYLPISAEVTFHKGQGWILVKFSNAENEYVFDAHRLMDTILFLADR
jgi:hypothetical protein